MRTLNNTNIEKSPKDGVESKEIEENLRSSSTEGLLIGNRVPKDFFWTTGTGESDITVHAGSYHLALRQAGIEMCNIMSYSSIMPKIAREVKRPENLVHGSVMESITAVATSESGKRATAGIIYGWLYDKKTGEKHGGLVCEYNGHDDERVARNSLKLSLNELYTNGYDDRFDLKGMRLTTKSFVPKKKYGTAIVAICFLNYVYPSL